MDYAGTSLESNKNRLGKLAMKRILRALSVTIFAAGFGVVMASPVGAEMSAAKQRQAAMKAIGAT